ncbi:hypothetical protein BpHYR1_029705 [Brachionus plicatilis]|uniref:Uncharacterized protein n=1 Tax=Brachionus plicatilis TaxID=10195 RepID=A0A3M7T3U6_BRAPC|nr:hypothetical protein BpHYR1_029705 [Brachionus plicatilis]
MNKGNFLFQHTLLNLKNHFYGVLSAMGILIFQYSFWGHLVAREYCTLFSELYSNRKFISPMSAV